MTVCSICLKHFLYLLIDVGFAGGFDVDKLHGEFDAVFDSCFLAHAKYFVQAIVYLDDGAGSCVQKSAFGFQCRFFVVEWVCAKKDHVCLNFHWGAFLTVLRWMAAISHMARDARHRRF